MILPAVTRFDRLTSIFSAFAAIFRAVTLVIPLMLIVERYGLLLMFRLSAVVTLMPDREYSCVFDISIVVALSRPRVELRPCNEGRPTQ